MRRYYALSILSGCAWAVIVYALSLGMVGPPVVGGLLASPFIGLLVGFIFRPAYKTARGWQVFVALLTLYLAAALFGLAVGVHDAFWRDIPNRITSAVVLQSVIAFVAGLTTLGYVVVLWPLAVLNHRLLARYCRPTEFG